MSDSLVRDRVRRVSLRTLLGADPQSRQAPHGEDDGDPDPSPLPAGRLAPPDLRWDPLRRRGTLWQGNRTHRHPSVPPVPSATPRGGSAQPSGDVAAPDAATVPFWPRQRIDPRFRQRRIQVKREEGRRRLRVLIAATTVLVVIVGALGAVRSPLFAARHVRVAGAVHMPVAAVLTAGHLRNGLLMIDVHPTRIAAGIERLPWVRTADVRTSWPDTVSVSIVERTPVAQVASATGPVLVDASGRVLAPASLGALEPPIAVDGGSPPVPAPVAPAPGADVAPVYGPGLAVAAAMPAALLRYVVRIIVVPGRSLGLQLDGGASAALGDSSDLPAKLSAVLTLVMRVRIGSSTIDATVPTAPVLTTGSGHA